MTFPLLVFAGLTGLVTAFALVGYGFGSLGRHGLRRAGRVVWLRSTAALLGAAAAALYTWGLLLVGGAVVAAEDGGTGSAPFPPCLTPGQEQRAAGVTDYRVDFLPLRFVCETSTGDAYASAAVPGYLNPAALGLALAATACAGSAGRTSGRRPGGLPAA
ncbi:MULTISPECIES: hypothetical protein [Streptomyces]|uniref:hypothetical protein n=1 Tax=Streptomyces TaxID=1883 RepID=UPI0022491384|nr:hypothetical protein [Streptomyces sp. JHD 1]MCX2971324.1 hypothetical protein [Streptomyces sp. JHD 1]